MITAASFKLDLNVESPVWQSIAPILSGRAVANGGLIGHHEYLFFIPCGLCPENGVEFFLSN